ncbi:MAG: hypothetical protein IJT56_02085 [Clostridia bacterium]|nr:hypothetical protein [Clostridia bacterium]
MKKTLSMILAALMLSSAAVLAACGGEQDASPASTTAAQGEDAPAETAAETTDADVRASIPDDLPDEDLGGYTYTIMTYSKGTYYQEEETGDLVNDTIYQRNRDVEERFNVKIAVNEQPGIQELDGAFKKLVQAGENTVDLCIPHQITSGVGFVTGHFIRNWNDVPYIDLSKPWWNSQINETLQIMGKQYYIAGSVTNPQPFCMLYNKTMAQNYALPDMYAEVRDGKWDIDDLREYAKLASLDINGDGTMNEEDQWGIVFNNDNQTLNFMYASDICSVIIADDGMPTPNVVNDKMITLVEKLYDLIYNDNRTLYCTYDQMSAYGNKAFTDGRSLFVGGGVGSAQSFRASEVDFGLIPYPKFDEAQSGYHTHVDAWNGALCIPKTASDEDLKRTGIIMTAMSAGAYKTVIPVVYDIALGTKYLRDEESREMMDIIYAGILYDFGYVFDNWNGCTWILPRMMGSKKTDVASYWASVEKKVMKNYEKIYAAVEADE